MASSSSQPPAKRRHVLADVAAISGTRVSAARIIKHLHDKGLLKNSTLFAASEMSLRRDASIGTADAVANRTSAYGPLIGKLKVGNIDIEYVNPFTYVTCMCSDHSSLYKLLCPNLQSSQRSIVLYVDEVRPGNPLRSDIGRTTQCVYWTFSDLPDKFLSGENTWFVATIVRSCIIDKIPGKVSALMLALLKAFFPAQGTSWTTGIIVGHGNEASALRATFGRFWGD